jgi:hypothetical protein
MTIEKENIVTINFKESSYRKKCANHERATEGKISSILGLW